MKNFLYSALAAGAVMSLASCSSDEPLNGVENDGSVQFIVSLDEIQSRAFGETSECNELIYTVFNEAGELVMTDTKQAAFGNGVTTATVNIQLVANEKYKVVFYAHNAESKFSTYSQGNISIHYENQTINSAIDDAFINKAEYNGQANQLFTADGQAKTVYLTRPFAQVNIGSDDLDNVAVSSILSGISTRLDINKGLYQSYSVLDNTVSDELTDTFTAFFNGLKANTDFPISGYSNLMSLYLLTDQSRSIIDARYTINHGATQINQLNLSSTPVQGNYRTNIYGSLLTTQNSFEVTINPAFEGVFQAWDGKTVTFPTIDETSKTVTISAPSDFAGFIEMVNGTEGETAKSFEGYTVTLTQDLDFGGHIVTPVADGALRLGSIASGNSFKGVLDGNNHTIKNLIIPASGKSSGVDAFVANLQGNTAALKNLKFENITINSTTAEQTGLVGLISNGATVENVHILSGTIHGKQATGGIVARILKNGTVSNCSNNADISSDNTNIGGIVGAAYYSDKSESNQMTISNCVNTGNVTGPKEVIGGIVGLNTGNVVGCVNKGTVTGTAKLSASYSVGGIVGDQQWAGTVENCINEGDVVNLSTSNNGTGGIIGWIRYSANSSSYQFKEIISVKGCTNKGNIRGYNSVGGIVGCSAGLANVIGCKNYSANISSYNWVAGIVGKIENSFPATLSAQSRVEIKDNLTTTTLGQMSVEETNTNSIKKSLVFNRNNPPHDPDNPIVIDENNTVPSAE